MDADTERRFADLVVARGLVRREALAAALARREQAARAGAPWRSLPEALVEAGALTVEAARAALAESGRLLVSPARRSSGRLPPPDLEGTARLEGPPLPLPPAPAGGPAAHASVAASVAGALPRAGSQSAVAPIPPAGARLGPYELQGELGRGAMGVVYRAVDTRLRRDVALKVLAASPDDGALEPFLKEARAAARLRHPGIVVVYGAEVIDGRGVVALELVEGRTLAARLRAGGPLPPREAAQLVADLAAAVDAAHREGVIHRDLKPANILVDRAGRPRLTDFGLARDQRASVQATAVGDILGTPAYMAPEQARGEVDLVDARTDVYGLGAVLYECLTGAPPFTGQTGVEVIRKVIDEEVRAPSAVRAGRGLDALAPDLETIALKALEKDRARRYPSAAGVEADLRRWLDGRAISARPPGRLERLARVVRRGRVAAAAGLAVVLTLALGGGGAAGWQAWRARARVDAALAVVAGGALRSRPAAREEVLSELLAVRSPATAARLAAALDEVSAELRAVRREALAAVAAPRTDGERARQDRLAGLDEALARLEALPPGAPLEPRLAAPLREARQRLLQRLRDEKQPEAAGSRGVEAWLARRQRERIGEDRLALAAVCCEALGRLGLLEAALPALGRYAFAEADELRALAAGEALVRLADPRALWVVNRAAERFGDDGAFAGRATRAMKALGAPPPFEPTTAEGLRDRGELRWLFRDEAGALADFDRALALDPRDARAWSDRGNLHAFRDRWELALVDLTRALELEPEEPRRWRERAEVRAVAGDLEGAVADCSRALELDPFDAHTWLARASVRSTRRLDLEGALADCDRALELDPTLADALAQRARARELLRDLTRALDDLNKAVALDATRAGLYTQRGQLLESLGRLTDAETDYDRALGLDPANPTALTRRGWCRSSRGDAAGALADLDRALELDPQRGEALALRGRVRAKGGETAAALADLDRAVVAAPREAVAWAYRGITRAERGDARRALEDLDRALELDPNERGALSWRAKTRLELDDLQGALADCDRALALDPQDPVLTCLRGMAYQGSGVLEEALRDYDRALQLKPRWADLHARKAETFNQLARHDLARREADAALEIDPKSERALQNRGIARYALGERDGARADLEAYFRLAEPGRDPGPRLEEVLRLLREKFGE